MKIDQARGMALSLAISAHPHLVASDVCAAAQKYLNFLTQAQPVSNSFEGPGPWRMTYEVKAKTPAKRAPVKKAAGVKSRLKP